MPKSDVTGSVAARMPRFAQDSLCELRELGGEKPLTAMIAANRKGRIAQCLAFRKFFRAVQNLLHQVGRSGLGINA